MKPIKQKQQRRGGFSALESIVTISILGVVMVTVMQATFGFARMYSQMRMHHVAQREAANAVERIKTLPWDRLSNETVDITENATNHDTMVALSREALQLLGPTATIDVVIDPGSTLDVAEGNAFNERRVTVRVSWLAGSESAGRSNVSLTFWQYRLNANSNDAETDDAQNVQEVSDEQ